MYSLITLHGLASFILDCSVATPASDSVFKKRELVGDTLSGVVSLVPSVISVLAADASNTAVIISALLTAIEDTVPKTAISLILGQACRDPTHWLLTLMISRCDDDYSKRFQR